MGMYLFRFWCLLACMANLELCSPSCQWELWKLENNKVYGADEETYRKIWEDNCNFVKNHNKQQNKTFTLELNHLADQKLARPGLNIQPQSEDVIDPGALWDLSFAPSSWDWRTKGAVSSVKNQDQEGAVAMTASDCVGSCNFIKGGKLQDLSSAEVHDCCSKNYSFVAHVFQCIHDIGGLCTSESYPEHASHCMNKTCQPAVKIAGGKTVPRGDEPAMMLAVYKTPVLALIDASHSSFQMYRSGVYNERRCRTSVPDHSVQVVGYGTMDGHDYWICKNNWGTSWGMNGYILMARNKGNMCGVASQTSYPV